MIKSFGKVCKPCFLPFKHCSNKVVFRLFFYIDKGKKTNSCETHLQKKKKKKKVVTFPLTFVARAGGERGEILGGVLRNVTSACLRLLKKEERKPKKKNNVAKERYRKKRGLFAHYKQKNSFPIVQTLLTITLKSYCKLLRLLSLSSRFSNPPFFF